MSILLKAHSINMFFNNIQIFSLLCNSNSNIFLSSCRVKAAIIIIIIITTTTTIIIFCNTLLHLIGFLKHKCECNVNWETISTKKRFYFKIQLVKYKTQHKLHLLHVIWPLTNVRDSWTCKCVNYLNINLKSHGVLQTNVLLRGLTDRKVWKPLI